MPRPVARAPSTALLEEKISKLWSKSRDSRLAFRVITDLVSGAGTKTTESRQQAR